MTQSGDDGADLMDGREKLFDRAFPAGTKIVTETHVESQTQRVRVRIFRETVLKPVDAAPRRRQ